MNYKRKKTLISDLRSSRVFSKMAFATRGVFLLQTLIYALVLYQKITFSFAPVLFLQSFLELEFLLYWPIFFALLILYFCCRLFLDA